MNGNISAQSREVAGTVSQSDIPDHYVKLEYQEVPEGDRSIEASQSDVSSPKSPVFDEFLDTYTAPSEDDSVYSSHSKSSATYPTDMVSDQRVDINVKKSTRALSEERPAQEDGETPTQGEPLATPKKHSRPTRLEPRRKRRLAPSSNGGRTRKHQLVRFAALYLLPVVLVIPLSFLLHLTTVLLTPLYNPVPLTLHVPLLFALLTIPPIALYWRTTLDTSPRQAISGPICISIAALAGDLVAFMGRDVGSLTGRALGPEWGVLIARLVLGAGVTGGPTAFALLCFDHVYPVPPATTAGEKIYNLIQITLRSTLYGVHLYLGERIWSNVLSSGISVLVRRAEKTILFISLLLTGLSLFIRPPPTGTSFANRVHSFLSNQLSLSSSYQATLSRVTFVLPRQVFPVLLIIRLPLLILVLRQQLFFHSHPPYITANGELRVLASEKSWTGQIVVAENVRDGYRFLRCDHSILGGRWMRQVPDIKGTEVDLGDSILATSPLQEIGILAHRSEVNDSSERVFKLEPGLELGPDLPLRTDDKREPQERALIIGLGVGIAAGAFANQNLAVDVVELDPAVYIAATEHFNLSLSETSMISLIEGATYIQQLAGTGKRWTYVVQQCFTGGEVPQELFSKEFWEDLAGLMQDDGIVAVKFVGSKGSSATKAVLVTLLFVFEQCRMFGDGQDKDHKKDKVMNMVILCTLAQSPLLTFRRPTRSDVHRSPLRSVVLYSSDCSGNLRRRSLVYSTFHRNEIHLDNIVTEEEWTNDDLILHRGAAEMDGWAIESSLSSWRPIQRCAFGRGDPRVNVISIDAGNVARLVATKILCSVIIGPPDILQVEIAT